MNTPATVLFSHDATAPERAPGILPAQEIKKFVSSGIVSSPESAPVADAQIQPASIDLRLGPKAYLVRASFLPGKSSNLLSKAATLIDKEIDLTQPALLERNAVYIVPLVERLKLPSDVRAIANPKSTTGRLDIFARLITENGDEFERVPKAYSGELYVEIVTRTFRVWVKEGMRLNQLRFVRGESAPLGEAGLKQLAKELMSTEEFSSSAQDEDAIQRGMPRGWPITVDLKGNGTDIVAYRANEFRNPIDLANVNHYEIEDFWDIIRRPKDGRLILEPGKFYLLASKRRVSVPPQYAAEMIAYDPTMGEFHVHYAGFFDPGFGWGSAGEVGGTRAVLEVRAHDMPVLLEDDQLVGSLQYYNMAAVPEKIYGKGIGSSYQKQELTPSKQFKIVPTEQQGGNEPNQLQWAARSRREIALLETH
jgi:dCTP deaminase